jgi:serine protease Do
VSVGTWAGRRSSHRRRLLGVLCGFVLVAGCATGPAAENAKDGLVGKLASGAPSASVEAGGQGGQSTAKATAEPKSTEAEPTPASTPEGTPAESGGGDATGDSLDRVRSATIQIEADGSFIDPQIGEVLNVAGRGSGFFVDPTGIAITNNHVVTGAAFLRVWIGGNPDPRNAQVLGVSECSDLAVVKVDTSDDVPFLRWQVGDVKSGMDIYVAGYPLGNPELTLTKGVISKAKANGETSWASIDSVIEHDANTNPGNSGGPVVTPAGRVVGVHFASDANGQHFAISEHEVQRIFDRLRKGDDVTSIGVNGQAVTNGVDISGIWVASVKSGSPADRAGVQGGDIITKLEGFVLSTDGTMADYCDVLRSRNADDVMSIQVLRFSTGEVLEGQLNGRPLEAV